MYFNKSSIASIAGIITSVLSQQISQDPGTGGVPVEVVHLYNDEFPQGSQYVYKLQVYSNLTTA